MQRFRFAAVLVAVLTLGAATVAFAQGRGDDDDDRGRGHDRGHHRGHHGDDDERGRRHHGRRGRFAVARLIDASGDRVGRVWLRSRGRTTVVHARVRNLPPGFHGFHIHTTGVCEPPSFTSAGGHYNPDGAQHRDHAGDLPTLLVTERGRARLATITDRFTVRDLRDADGSAVMVHELPDNYANIPDRYGEPDAETLSTGDAGSRLACGEVR